MAEVRDHKKVITFFKNTNASKQGEKKVNFLVLDLEIKIINLSSY